jgi:hypothetical protein
MRNPDDFLWHRLAHHRRRHRLRLLLDALSLSLIAASVLLIAAIVGWKVFG